MAIGTFLEMTTNPEAGARRQMIMTQSVTMLGPSHVGGLGRLGPSRSSQLTAARAIASGIAAPLAADIDSQARFPHEVFDALKQARLLSAPVPEALGGTGTGMADLAAICSTIAQACGASGMILAMHYIQVACIARHSRQSAFFQQYLRDLVERQYLIASATSEVGTGGDTRSSICAAVTESGRFTLEKNAPTISYGNQSDALLITCRRSADAASGDQILVLALKDDCTLASTSSWDPLGMRGTCSPGSKLVCSGSVEQVVPDSFADVSAQTMVPFSHILWSSVWYGIAADAVARAGAFVRAEARRNPGTTPPTATRLAEVSSLLQTMRNNWTALASEFDACSAQPASEEHFATLGWALKMNHLKVSTSELAPQVVHRALQIIGIMGYKNDSPFSVGRHYRDVLSASLMIANDRIASKSASMLLVYKDES